MTVAERRPRVLLIDPSLRSAAGHHLGVFERFRDELVLLGGDVTSLVSMFAESAFCRDHRLVAVFEKSLYFRSAFTRAEFDEGAAKFARDLAKTVRRRRLSPELIVLAAADQTMVMGLARALKRLVLQPEIVVWLPMEPHVKKPADDPSVAPLLEEYREALAALRDAVPEHERLHIVAESKELRRIYAPFVEGLEVRQAAAHRLVRKPRPPRHRRPDEPINIACAGNANIAKGYGMLPDAIRRLGALRSDLRFSVHGTVDQTDDPTIARLFADIAAAGSNVSVRTDALPWADYVKFLSDADFVLLPYDPQRYRTCESGIFGEATRLGVPAIATRGCGFAEHAIEQGRAMPIERHDAGSVVDAVMRAASEVSSLTARAAMHAQALKDDHAFETILANAMTAAQQQAAAPVDVSRRLRESLLRPLRLAADYATLRD